MECQYLINHFDTHDSEFLPRWVLIHREEFEQERTYEEAERINIENGGRDAGVLGEFATLSELKQAIADHQWQQDRLIAAATPEPAPDDPGPRPGGVRDMALQKIK
jgi:hypothetical protein